MKRVMRQTQEYFSVHDLLEGKVGNADIPETMLRLLVRLAEEVIPESEPTRIYAATLAIAVETLKATRAGVFTQVKAGELYVAARHPNNAEFEIPAHFYAAVMDRRGVVLMRDGEERKKKADKASSMALPLFNPNGVMGVLYVETDVAETGGFDESSASFGSVITSLIGPAVYTAHRVKSLHAERAQLLAQLRTNRKGNEEGSSYMAGNSGAVVKLREQIGSAARNSRSVLITGEVGTGKESVARAIHLESTRRERAFVPVLCAALTADTLARELLGDGTSSKPSLYQLSVGGTLFLDDIALLPVQVQQELVSVLTAHSGEAAPRLVASSTRPLDDLVKAKSVIEPMAALFGVTVHTPPLRERREDIAVMARTLVLQHGANMSKSVTLSSEALAALERMEYKQNIRDLSHIIERAMIVLENGAAIDERHVSSQGSEAEGQSLKEAVNAFERAYILRVLAEQHGHRTRTAKVLGLSRQALSEKLRKYGLRDQDQESDDE
jgi:transcriptional regulator with GAF, ATPase, and Fis domain